MAAAWCGGCPPGKCVRRARPRTAPRRAAPATAQACGPGAAARRRTKHSRCPGISSAGSRRSAATRRGATKTSPDALLATGGRASTGWRSPAPLPCRGLAPRPPGAGSLQGCPAWARWRRARHRPNRWRRGCQHRPAPRSGCCWGLCGCAAQWGGWAAGTARRTPFRGCRAAAR
ncbi:hypothetical protein G6F57_020332 [Rhizopus arrhizus]|nr:hypothetical protein G6F57_020332 [Rhizopus arrhizus]